MNEPRMVPKSYLAAGVAALLIAAFVVNPSFSTPVTADEAFVPTEAQLHGWHAIAMEHEGGLPARVLLGGAAVPESLESSLRAHALTAVEFRGTARYVLGAIPPAGTSMGASLPPDVGRLPDGYRIVGATDGEVLSEPEPAHFVLARRLLTRVVHESAKE